METSASLSNILPRVLIFCGILASLLKAATDALAITKWKEYNFVAQSISELSAAGAPTRSLVVPLDLVYGGLMIAFGVGLWYLAGSSLLMRIAAGLIASNAVISGYVILFLPMHINQGAAASASTIHVVLMATGVFAFLIAMGLAGAAYHNWFRTFSYGILAVYFLLTIARFLLPSPTTSAGLPAPMAGIQERTMVSGYLVWVVVLASAHLLKPGM